MKSIVCIFNEMKRQSRVQQRRNIDCRLTEDLLCHVIREANWRQPRRSHRRRLASNETELKEFAIIHLCVLCYKS